MPIHDRGQCACCGGGTPRSAYTYSCYVPFTYVASGEDYYHTPIWQPYQGNIGTGAVVVIRIVFDDNSTKDVEVPITDANKDGLYGSNTLNIASGVTFDDGGYRFVMGPFELYRPGSTFPTSGTTYDVVFNGIAHDGAAESITPIN